MAINRRDFLAAVTAAWGGASMSLAAGSGTARQSGEMTVRDVIDLVLRNLPADPASETVDTVKIGDASQPVSGIVTTFMATVAVIRRAAQEGANLIITHEPTFYNHLDESDWLTSDPVYREKVRLIEENGIVVWRLHDHLHRAVHDDITDGVLRTLEWKDYASPDDNYVCTIPESTLANLAAFVKERLGATSVRMIGDPAMRCSEIGVLMGAWGGRRQIEFISRPDIDVLVCGEAREWETPEYVRDANALGASKGLLVVGHALSEEPGMLWFTEWLRERLPAVDVLHVPAGDPFAYV